MELKVIIDGYERSVSGVNENTTCSQIIYALANAISARGRFVIVEKYRNMERRLAPNDRPLETFRKWREHAANVTFQMLRVNSNDEICGRNAIGHQQATPLENGQRSTCSLPAYPSGVTGTLGRSTRRPPPPDYKFVMEQKNLQTLENQPRVEKFRNPELENHRDYMAYEEELQQLLVQQKNLRAILQPLIAANWPQKYQQEIKKSHKLRASLEATREALDKTKSDILKVQEKEKELMAMIENFKEDETKEELNVEEESILETSIDLNISSGSSSQPQLSV
ncbi:unnamed protein product [Caenorhabditis bovis]|uniref:Ras-associating domain-containing protein n=1 Tax=Caenorhabditis bovis TaxID=2654633 RepID=A0A8S1EB25_9PELO|nr:unnamed protein product [Caenorhabditis bovis]